MSTLESGSKKKIRKNQLFPKSLSRKRREEREIERSGRRATKRRERTIGKNGTNDDDDDDENENENENGEVT